MNIKLIFKRTFVVIFSVILVFGLFTTNIYAQKSDKIELTEQEILKIKNFLTDYGVNESTQEELIDKYKNGEMWDSITDSSNPINIQTIELDGETQTICYYHDGSVSVTTMPKKPDNQNQGYNLRSVSGGTWRSGSGYSNCYGATVRVNHGIVDMSFQADFSLVNQGYSEIIDVYHGDYFVAGGSISSENLRINRKKEDRYHPAEAEYSINFDLIKIGGSWKYTVWLKVQGSKYWDENQYLDK